MANPFADLKPITNDIDELPLRFGKYKGRTPNEVARYNPGYIVWLWHNIANPPVTKLLVQACEDAVDEADEGDFADEDHDSAWLDDRS